MRPCTLRGVVGVVLVTVMLAVVQRCVVTVGVVVLSAFGLEGLYLTFETTTASI